ncbi:MAG: hypothetical protein COB02_03020 [Candidatus Cloacimonadota bacterium]|nr:MAG: hypothetical protein COB02_03020 [Candidatus Cloacimonadota bacterium]
MKFITYTISNEDNICSLNTPHTSLDFENKIKEDALSIFEHFKYSYLSVAGIDLGQGNEQKKQFNVYVPVNKKGLFFIQQIYYSIVASGIIALITLSLFHLVSSGDSKMLNYPELYHFYQILLNYGFALSSAPASSYNIFSMAFLFMTPFFVFFEILITMPLYLFIKPLASFLPARVLRLIFHELF